MIIPKGSKGLELATRICFDPDGDDLRLLLLKFKEVMNSPEGERAVALASNQVVSNTNHGAPTAYYYNNRMFINASYSSVECPQTVISYETCMSDPNAVYGVPRYPSVVVRYQQLIIVAGQLKLSSQYTLLCRGYPAIVHQHEIDHTNGAGIWRTGTLLGQVH